MPAGRPVKFKATMIQEAESLCSLGFTEEHLAHYWKVSFRTVQRWKSKTPELCRAIDGGKLNRNVTATQRLFDLVTAGNLTAIIFWLTNRCPEIWADKRSIVQNNNTFQAIKNDGPQRQINHIYAFNKEEADAVDSAIAEQDRLSNPT